MKLLHMDDDTLILILGFLPGSSIIVLRLTCYRLASISKFRFIWRQACVDQVLRKGYPVPALPRQLSTASVTDLERLVIRAQRLGAFWTSPSVHFTPRSFGFQATEEPGLSHVQFLAGHGGRYLVTVYKGHIWSTITCWVIGDPANVQRIGDWSYKDVTLDGFVVNSDPDSPATLAVAVQHGSGSHSIEILSVTGEYLASCFKSICSIATTFRLSALRGELIAFSDKRSETVIMNWRKNTFALLKSFPQQSQYNPCSQVVFAYKSILVVRACSIELFPEPELRPADGEYATYHPIGFHSFGRMADIVVNVQNDPLVDARGAGRCLNHAPLSILLRAKKDALCASKVDKLEQFVLFPNPVVDHASTISPSVFPSQQPNGGPDAEVDIQPTVVPYLFPPVRTEHTLRTPCGFVHCRDIALGPAGTALWIQPPTAWTGHPAQPTDGVNPDCQNRDPRTVESLCAAVFAGPLQRSHPDMQTRARTLWVPQQKENRHWTSFDYDEERGRVALGWADGGVRVLDLV